jgi:hypothetical protein
MVTHRLKSIFCRLLTIGLAPALLIPAHAALLAEYEWQSRPLLVFASSEDDAMMKDTRRHLQTLRCELNDRHMIIGYLPSHGSSTLHEKPITARQATELRNLYRITHDQFTVLLIGKDGGEKYRTTAPPDMRRIFNLIDGMPMRQDEMQQYGSQCR